MGKIKNWKRQKSTENRLDHVKYQWINEALPVQRTVRIEKFPDSNYRVNYSESSKNPDYEAKTLENARKWAVKWLKNNPAPDVPESVRQEAM